MLKKNIIIDSRIRDVESKYLSEYFNVIKLPLSDDVYEEISGHSDIFYCKINNEIICAPNAKILDKSFICGNLRVGDKYPRDVLYNVCQIGNKLIVNKFADEKIKKLWSCKQYLDKEVINNQHTKTIEGKNVITVNQGYVKCSIAVTGDNSCIISDEGIYKKLKQTNIDVDLIKEDNICLLDKKSNKSKMSGFIGGATLTFDNKFVIFGDIENLSKETKDTIKSHLSKHNLELITFNDLEVYDYGGGIIF